MKTVSVITAEEAAAKIHSGDVLIAGGFGMTCNPVHLLHALAETDVKDLTYIGNYVGEPGLGGGRLLRCGPTKDVNFPYVVLGRAIYHHARVAGRTHANRGALTLGDDDAGPGWIDRIPREQRKAIEKSFARLRNGAAETDVTEDLALLLTPIVEEGGAVPGQ